MIVGAILLPWMMVRAEVQSWTRVSASQCSDLGTGVRGALFEAQQRASRPALSMEEGPSCLDRQGEMLQVCWEGRSHCVLSGLLGQLFSYL